MVPPVLAVPGGELVGEFPELGAVEGAELQQAVPAPGTSSRDRATAMRSSASHAAPASSTGGRGGSGGGWGTSMEWAGVEHD
jgi:hypothetical protein